MKKKIVQLFLILTLTALFIAPSAMAEGVLGTLHEYAPYSFWTSADGFLDDPAMNAAFEAIAVAAAAMGKNCYDADGVKEFMADMFACDFAALAVGKKNTFIYYDDDGDIDAICRYKYQGTETVEWMGFPVEWHKYKRSFCISKPTNRFLSRFFRTHYKYVVATQVHQDGEEGMIHAHFRYGNTSFDDLMNNPDYAMWWPTLALYGDTTVESLAEDMAGAPEEYVFMLPDCPVE